MRVWGVVVGRAVDSNEGSHISPGVRACLGVGREIFVSTVYRDFVRYESLVVRYGPWGIICGILESCCRVKRRMISSYSLDSRMIDKLSSSFEGRGVSYMRWSVDLLQWPLQTTDPYADFGVSVALFGTRT